MSNGVKIEEWDRSDLWSSFLVYHFEYGRFWFGVREGMLGAYCWLLWLVLVGVGPHTLGTPQTGLKSLLGWHIPKIMCPQPWHLKHGRELVSFLFEVLPWLSLDPWLFPWLWPVVPVPWPAATLWAVGVCPRTVLPLWELRWLGAFLSICPLPWPLCWAIWSTAGPVALYCSCQGSHQPGCLVYNSVAPLTGSVVTASLFSLSTLQAVTMSWE